MKMGDRPPIVSRCRVERGMYALRYVAAADRPYPTAEIDFEAGQLDITTAPGRDEAILDGPGQVLVVIAQEPCEFDLKVSAVDGGGTDAQLALDLIDSGKIRQHWSSASRERGLPRNSHQIETSQSSVGANAELTVLAHVSRRGDVRVGADTWVAGPSEVLQIEGLAIATGQHDLDVRIRVQTAHGGQRWSRWYEAGEFAGSRQKADPLTGVSIALQGEEAHRFTISADVMALGSPSQTKTGQAVEFYGPDPIVGFRLRLNPVNTERGSVGLGMQSGATVRVFRAKR